MIILYLLYGFFAFVFPLLFIYALLSNAWFWSILGFLVCFCGMLIALSFIDQKRFKYPCAISIWVVNIVIEYLELVVFSDYPVDDFGSLVFLNSFLFLSAILISIKLKGPALDFKSKRDYEKKEKLYQKALALKEENKLLRKDIENYNRYFSLLNLLRLCGGNIDCFPQSQEIKKIAECKQRISKNTSVISSIIQEIEHTFAADRINQLKL